MPTNRDYWKSLSDAWEESGQSQRKFCEEKEISFTKFTQWRSMLLSEDRRSQIDFIKLDSARLFSPLSLPAQPSISSAQPSKVDSYIEIKLPHGIVMKIPANVAQ